MSNYLSVFAFILISFIILPVTALCQKEQTAPLTLVIIRVTIVDAEKGVIAGYSVQKEMVLWQEAGISPAEILCSATIIPVKFMAVDSRLGTVAEGTQLHSFYYAPFHLKIFETLVRYKA